MSGRGWSSWARVGVCVVASVGLHIIADVALSKLPPRPPSQRATRVTMTVHTPEPVVVKAEPEVVAIVPEPVPEPVVEPLIEPEVVPEPQPTPKPNPKPEPATRKPSPPDPNPKQEPKADTPPPSTAPGKGPIALKGITLDSTSPTGSGTALPTGNTHAPTPGNTTTDPKPLPPSGGVAPTQEVSKMPTMQGECRGKYTEQARDAGVEGTVTLDLVVGADGKARDIKVVKGLGHGLDEAAIAALARCRFKPGLRNGDAVAVQLRAFKVRFFMNDTF